jgi:hypothetical protein
VDGHGARAPRTAPPTREDKECFQAFSLEETIDYNNQKQSTYRR